MDTVEHLEFLFSILWWRGKKPRTRMLSSLPWHRPSSVPSQSRKIAKVTAGALGNDKSFRKIPSEVLAKNSQQAMCWKQQGGELLWKQSVSRYFSKMKVKYTLKCTPAISVTPR